MTAIVRSTMMTAPAVLGLLLLAPGCAAPQAAMTHIAVQEALGGCEGCRAPTSGSAPTTAADAAPPAARPEESRMWMTVGERRFAVTLTDNAAARAFAARLPLTLEMSDLNGNEKYADLQEALPGSASRPGTIHNGDLMLYGSNTVVVFYVTFNSSYSYTRLGRVDDPAGLAQALGPRGVRVVFSED
jgi:hypothetical protein